LNSLAVIIAKAIRRMVFYDDGYHDKSSS
jgi:hypothetical protein